MATYNKRRSISEYIPNQDLLSPYDFQQPLGDFSKVTDPLDQMYNEANKIGAGLIKPIQVLPQDQSRIDTIQGSYQQAVDSLSDSSIDPYTYERKINHFAKQYAYDLEVGELAKAKEQFEKYNKIEEIASTKFGEGKITDADKWFYLETPLMSYQGGANSNRGYDTGIREPVEREDVSKYMLEVGKQIKANGLDIGNQRVKSRIDRTGKLIFENLEGERISPLRANTIFKGLFESNPNFMNQLEVDRNAAMYSAMTGSNRFSNIPGSQVFKIVDPKQLAQYVRKLYANELKNGNEDDVNVINNIINEVAQLNPEDDRILDVQTRLFDESYIKSKINPIVDATSYSDIKLNSRILNPKIDNEGGSKSSVGKIPKYVAGTLYTSQLGDFQQNSPYESFSDLVEDVSTLEENEQTLIDQINNLKASSEFSNDKGSYELSIKEHMDSLENVRSRINEVNSIQDNIVKVIKEKPEYRDTFNKLEQFATKQGRSLAYVVRRLTETNAVGYAKEDTRNWRKALKNMFSDINIDLIKNIDNEIDNELESLATKTVSLVGASIHENAKAQILKDIEANVDRYSMLTEGGTERETLDDLGDIDWSNSTIDYVGTKLLDNNVVYSGVLKTLDGESIPVTLMDNGDRKVNTVAKLSATNHLVGIVEELNKLQKQKEAYEEQAKKDPEAYRLNNPTILEGNRAIYDEVFRSFNTILPMFYAVGGGADEKIVSEIIRKLPNELTQKLNNGNLVLGDLTKHRKGGIDTYVLDLENKQYYDALVRDWKNDPNVSIINNKVTFNENSIPLLMKVMRKFYGTKN